MATEAHKKQTEAEVVEITVRDRRRVHQFSIHNLIIDEWLPIITIRGLALYAFYVRLANQKDERSYPGYRLIQEHLSMSPSTISDYNKLLEWCELIHIEPGDRVTSNDYYILDVPQATPEKLDEIRRKAKAQLSPKSTFLKALLRRLDEWQPIQALWDRTSSKRTIIVHKAQMALPLDDPNGGTVLDQEGLALDQEGATPGEQGTTSGEHPATPGEHPATPGEHPVTLAEQGATPGEHPATPGEEGTSPGVAEQSEATIRSNNPKGQSEATAAGGVRSNDAAGSLATTASFLQQLGITEPTLSQIAGRDPVTAQAWWWYIQTQPGLADKGTGYLINRLLDDDAPLPGYAELARTWRELTDEQRWTLLQAERDHRLYRRSWQLPDDFPSLSQDARAALTDLARAEVDFGVVEPAPELPTCPACDRPAIPCPDCDRCPGCCTCEPVAEDPALAEAQKIWRAALETLAWRMEQGTVNARLKPLDVVGLEDGELSLAVENERVQEQLEQGLNRAGIVDQALTEAAGRPLKARFVVAGPPGPG